MRVRFTAITIGAVLAIALMLGPPGSAAPAPAPAPAPAQVPAPSSAQPRVDGTSPRACYIDEHRPCSAVKYAKKASRMFRHHRNKRIKHTRKFWRKMWKHPKKVRRMVTRKMRKHHRYAGMSEARMWRSYMRGSNCYIDHPWTSLVNCKNGVHTNTGGHMPDPLKIVFGCTGGAGTAALLIPGYGWAAFGGGAVTCTSGLFIRKYWSDDW